MILGITTQGKGNGTCKASRGHEFSDAITPSLSQALHQEEDRFLQKLLQAEEGPETAALQPSKLGKLCTEIYKQFSVSQEVRSEHTFGPGLSSGLGKPTSMVTEVGRILAPMTFML